MGFNISGIAINKSFKDNFDELLANFNWDVVFHEEVTFEEASKNWKDKELCDVFFTETGTLLFVNMDLCIEPWRLKDCNVFTFTLSETSMAFSIQYSENLALKRSIMEVNGERLEDSGDSFDFENEIPDTAEIIWRQLGIMLGKSFWDIDFQAPCHRYSFEISKNVNYDYSEKTPHPELGEVVLSISEHSRKKWWQFWR
jgi:hypothetical protein